MKGTNLGFIGFIAFYGLQLVLALFNILDAPIIDLCVVNLILILFFILHLKFKFNNGVIIGLGFGFLLHIIGLYNIVPYGAGNFGTLYGWVGLSYHYDLIVHSVGVFFFSVAVCSLFSDYLEDGLKSKMMVFIILLFFILGIGAFNEIVEYIGFDIFGYGSGFLEFGAGDSSPIGGPWENASLDMLANLFGGLIGIGGYLIRKRALMKED